MKTKMIPVGIYPASVIITSSRKEFARIRAKYTKNPPLDLSNADGICFHDKKGQFVVGLFDNSPGTLVHELAHATFHILAHAGVKASHKNQETFAYLQQWLFNECIDILT